MCCSLIGAISSDLARNAVDGSPVEGYGTCCAKVVIEDVVIMVDNVSDPEGGKRCLHTHNQAALRRRRDLPTRD
jgi:hypothetical protein